MLQAGTGRAEHAGLVAALVGLWGWRVELALLAAPVLAWWLLAGSLAEREAAAIVAWAVAVLLVSPWRRAVLVRLLRACRVRRRFRRAWLDGGGLPPTRLACVRVVPAGEVARVRVRPGARSRTSRRAASSWRPRSACASCA
jgi:hypothetical protein